MSYQPPLPNTGVILPVPGSGQAWEVAVHNGNFTGVENAITADRARLSTIESKIANNALVPAGTSTARDGFYGVPSTAAGRVALANGAPRWFNTEKGYEERYFAPTSDSATPGYNTLYARSGGGWLPDGKGLVPINWQNVTNVGGTVAVNGNTISVTAAATTVTADGCFTADFDKMLIIADINFASAAELRLWMRKLGVSDTGANYNRQISTASGTSSTAASFSNETSMRCTHTTVTGGYFEFLVFNAANASRGTFVRDKFIRTDAIVDASLSHTTVQADDGISFITSGPGFTGSIQLFGYAGGHI